MYCHIRSLCEQIVSFFPLFITILWGCCKWIYGMTDKPGEHSDSGSDRSVLTGPQTISWLSQKTDVPLDVSLAIHYSTHPSFPLLYFPPSPLPSVSFSLFWNVVCSSLLPSLSSDCSFSSTLFMLFDYRVPSVIWISLINKLQYCFSTVCVRKKHSTATLQQHYTNWPKRVTVITVEEMSLPTDPRFAQDMNGLYFQW